MEIPKADQTKLTIVVGEIAGLFIGRRLDTRQIAASLQTTLQTVYEMGAQTATRERDQARYLLLEVIDRLVTGTEGSNEYLRQSVMGVLEMLSNGGGE